MKRVIPISAHSAFEKAANYFMIKLVKIPVDSETFKVDLNKMRKAINSNTVLVVGSAPNFPNGVIDDIEAIASMAKKRDICCHVDACLGGFLLPWFKKIKGAEVPNFDFSVPGVTSMSKKSSIHFFSNILSKILTFS